MHLGKIISNIGAYFQNPPIRSRVHSTPTLGKEGKQGCPTTTYINKLLKDTCLENITVDLESFFSDQDLWGQFSSRHLLSVDTKFIKSTVHKSTSKFEILWFQLHELLLSKGCIENRPVATQPNFKFLLNLFKKTGRTICHFSEDAEVI